MRGGINESDIIVKQQAICTKYGSAFLPSPFNSIIGVAVETFDDSSKIIHGLRHPVEDENFPSWYIWAGEYSSSPDFFKPMHVEHVLELNPKITLYLGLQPGWRFLFDNSYEDVWFDENLLQLKD